MPYVERDQTNKVVGIFARPQEGIGVEFLPDNDTEIIEFRIPKQNPRTVAPPPPAGVSVPALRDELAALRQALLDAGILVIGPE